ncbi:bifunctional phosphoribosyl-AMP cyclohydrolase; phosphoribosyl-ATP pyrophosphohydrolase [Petrocella atlantisensis]|uniref:Histidine biosynthesis bifunctional protein HisIE n=1 Tax=Petrocella atlantisensis TaxID=2173034 RepID=A0A3P7P6G9_9FIRM|nr:bifunctional phosphoribosyl-AMP cyclohydrolase/phosphoribosyl-ATP diphosphatase HisIE [Petrocella atlantisensis]PKM54486.1 MAG: bifunctional phosphoribosyl-AMP cyclohydrolase/phosphoribosyl-ATP diphosphatase [Firmicutes bacterium HGW-Firmicutes-5]VDN45943.1 bifunctional phosphoribosyl-AMP cyclohydrolase; phosphoribosyl-ATP pyrophosphohydrolase [Petrocella atlantisensis]
MNFNDFKLGEDGLLPVIVQDYMSSQVLMMAYMNEEAYKKTVETGKATFYSRSRKSLWIKGETSGHYQTVKEIALDCDQDTLLLKVHQEGNACHTGAYSCFYRYLDATEGNYIEVDTYKQKDVLSGVYDVVMDRKVNPKEGSYTNYLFDKGIDKILKKVGEETAEIIIGAKNEGKEEMVYEISDLLYHLTVLMVEKGANWEDIYKELDKRR